MIGLSPPQGSFLLEDGLKASGAIYMSTQQVRERAHPRGCDGVVRGILAVHAVHLRHIYMQ